MCCRQSYGQLRGRSVHRAEGEPAEDCSECCELVAVSSSERFGKHFREQQHRTDPCCFDARRRSLPEQGKHPAPERMTGGRGGDQNVSIKGVHRSQITGWRGWRGTSAISSGSRLGQPTIARQRGGPARGK